LGVVETATTAAPAIEREQALAWQIQEKRNQQSKSERAAREIHRQPGMKRASHETAQKRSLEDNAAQRNRGANSKSEKREKQRQQFMKLMNSGDLMFQVFQDYVNRKRRRNRNDIGYEINRISVIFPGEFLSNVY
jgi:hypothetical protein